MRASTDLITYEESLTMPERNLEDEAGFVSHPRHGFLLQRNPLRYRIPDLAIVNRAAWKNDLRATSDPYSHVVPLLVAEVVSPSHRKGHLERLLSNYADFQIPEVLLFFPETRTYESRAGLAVIDSAQCGVVSPRTMPEVSLDLDRFWDEF